MRKNVITIPLPARAPAVHPSIFFCPTPYSRSATTVHIVFQRRRHRKAGERKTVASAVALKRHHLRGGSHRDTGSAFPGAQGDGWRVRGRWRGWRRQRRRRRTSSDHLYRARRWPRKRGFHAALVRCRVVSRCPRGVCLWTVNFVSGAQHRRHELLDRTRKRNQSAAAVGRGGRRGRGTGRG